MPGKRNKRKGKRGGGRASSGRGSGAKSAPAAAAASPSAAAATPAPSAMTTPPPKARPAFGPAPPPSAATPRTPAKATAEDDASSLSSASGAGGGLLPDLVGKQSGNNGQEAASSDGSYSIPPLAKRDDSSSSSSSSDASSIGTVESAKEGSPSSGGVPRTVQYSSASSSDEEDDDVASDVDDELSAEDVTPEAGGEAEDAPSIASDDSGDGMPALVQRDESSQSSNDSSDSMPQLVNRSTEKQKQQPRSPAATAAATATPSPVATKAKKKKPRKKKKKKAGKAEAEDPEKLATTADLTVVRGLLSKYNMADQDESTVYAALTSGRCLATGSMTGPQRLEAKFLLELAHGNFKKLAAHVGANASRIPAPAFVVKKDEGIPVGLVLAKLFSLVKSEAGEPLWTLLDDATTAPILEAALSSSVESLKWFERYASDALEAFVGGSEVRQLDVTALLDAGVRVSCASVAALFSGLPKGRGHQFNNLAARILYDKSEIFMTNQNDFKLVMDAISDTVGKQGKTSINLALKQASSEMHRAKNKQRSPDKMADASALKSKAEAKKKESAKSKKAQEEAERKLAALKLKTEKITSALQWYNNLLDELNKKAAKTVATNSGRAFDGDVEDEKKCDDEDDVAEDPSGRVLVAKPKRTLTSDQVCEALSSCNSEDALVDVESSIDLLQWDAMSEWTIDITEQAHKFFRRHVRKDRALCERVVRRLTLLSTGRWPYVLCKPLKSRTISGSSKKLHLYETKIDAASRIIWEVAVAFSPRRSRLDQNYCEQVIRVWDIVLDHDNLSSAIELTVERIEKSHLRGESCAIHALIDRTQVGSTPEGTNNTKGATGVTRIPRVFPMSSEVVSVGSSYDQTPNGRSRHFHPASDDPRQYTLLKFYELNQGAVQMLLDGQDEQNDLPFSPGPKEHEIIHYQSDPQRSVLLMGRSGTGKTTCLVFRMWAQYTSYADGQHGARPRQLFVTKNEVLCREVMRSFNNMGLAWRKRRVKSEAGDPATMGAQEKPKFLTSHEWLDALDVQLPGEPFFAKNELKQRFDLRKHSDSVTKGIEAWLSEENDTDESTDAMSLRKEMSYTVFQKMWRKIRSGSGSQMDCTIVWREIKSFIKGSVAALQIDREDRTLPQKRFLSLEEYLALPRKQSRMDESQRREVYELYLNYERVKKEGLYYDEADLVYNLAGRVAPLDQRSLSNMAGEDSLLPIDSLFVDEVQDFTQAELFILAKLCRDPNNLFLAGDTAQSIAVGVDFRFVDVRQIFYNSFGGVEPKLLQLTHNYRSHAGILRLAACVVELLYHFFGNSLDRLPPDLGLFSGPKPVVMDVASTQELVLMLQGAKRASRIEFGAHQVVIVRSEEAKRRMPEEFGIDPDWVMTVQESKGLEFDDVLLYNFFSDSPAEDLWRVVSSYSEDDIASYYADATVAASGVQKYDWDSPLLKETRHLDFDADQHKSLEVELKMLYTAITRARVNIFIAETNTESSRPMFNYFQRRAVVDVCVSKENSEEEGLSGVRVFGAMNTVEDWRNRGEYYLRNAEGDRQTGCLRLAAKCFDKAGEPARRDYALAFLSFTEIDEQDPAKLRGKQGVELRAKLYSITEKLLEARDVGFLNKAALCLLRTGEQDEYTAQLFEQYARLRYTQRICDEEEESLTLPLAPSGHEKKYFSYAAKLFSKCSQQREQPGAKFDLALSSFRNYVCAGMYDAAAELVTSGALPIQDNESFQKLYQLCIPASPMAMDPTASFRKDFRLGNCQGVTTAVKQAASRL